MNSFQRQEKISQIQKRYKILIAHLSEKGKRIWAASEAAAIGHGGVSIVCEATGISRVTISKGKKEIADGSATESVRIRKKGGGRKRVEDNSPEIIKELDIMIDPFTRGDPESPLRWTCKSTYNLAEALQNKGYSVSQKSVYTLMQKMGYSMQSNSKKKEGKQHPDRDAQFRFISKIVNDFQRKGYPVISVDAKKKENIGEYKNNGKEWEKKRQPTAVNTYDFPDKEKGKACPYGVFDMARNEGWVNVGVSKDTAEFAVESIRRWWFGMGCFRHPDVPCLLITADGGGSNGYRVRLWKREIQKFADETAMSVYVGHFPPGTSKWNKIEHQMFSFVSKNWRGRPLDSIGTIVNLISNTTTKSGLTIKAEVDENSYERGIKVSDEEMKSLNIDMNNFHGEWNYSIAPRVS
jgi:hypothetical protein